MTNLSEGLYMGDQAAFAAIYEQYHAELCRHASKHANTDVAKDIVESVFLHLRQYKGHIRRIRPFLYRLTTLEEVRWLRVMARHAHEQIDDAVTYQTPETLACQAERAQAVKEAIRRLPPSDQAAIRASYYDDLSSDEVAQRLGCTPNAARLRISRAIKKLRLDLQQVIEYH